MPPVPASLTVFSHRPLGADPFPLKEEVYLLMEKASPSGKSGVQERRVNLRGNCFLRVDADQRLSWSLEFHTLDMQGLANYFPGRNLADRLLGFENGETLPFQFKSDGIFIYESVSATDVQGDLRSGSVSIDYDMHTGLDESSYPVIIPVAGYADVIALPDLDTPEVTDTIKLATLFDVFNGLTNISGNLTVTPYDGNPAGAGVAIDIAAVSDPWTTLSAGYSAIHSVIRNTFDILWATSAFPRSCTHFRIERNGYVVADLALAVPLLIAAGDYLRARTGSLGMQMTWPWDSGAPSDVLANPPADHFLQYIAGGDRSFYLPSHEITLYFYEDVLSPYVDNFNVVANATNFTVGPVALPLADGDAAGDFITSIAHGLRDGDRVSYISGTGFGGLDPAVPYFVGVGSPDTFGLYPTYLDALAATNLVDITTDGTGGIFNRPHVVIPGTLQGTNSPAPSWSLTYIVMKPAGLDTALVGESVSIAVSTSVSPYVINLVNEPVFDLGAVSD